MSVLLLAFILTLSNCTSALRLSTAGSSHDKIMIVTSAQGMNATLAQNKNGTKMAWYGNFGGEQQIKINRDRYASLHGYETFTIIKDSQNVSLPAVETPPWADQTWTPDARWTKVRMLKKLMHERSDVEWFVWIDGDAVIVDYKRSMDTFVDLARDHHHLIIPQPERGCLWSSNHFYVRNSNVGRSFVDKWFDALTGGCLFARLYGNCFFGDQCHMWQVVANTLNNLTGDIELGTKMALDRSSHQHCSMGSEADDVEMTFKLFNVSGSGNNKIAKAFETLAWTSESGGHDCRDENATNSATRYAGPFVFAAYDTLLHDCNRGPQQKEVLEKAFILHKPRAGCGAFYKKATHHHFAH